MGMRVASPIQGIASPSISPASTRRRCGEAFGGIDVCTEVGTRFARSSNPSVVGAAAPGGTRSPYSVRKTIGAACGSVIRAGYGSTASAAAGAGAGAAAAAAALLLALLLSFSGAPPPNVKPMAKCGSMNTRRVPRGVVRASMKGWAGGKGGASSCQPGIMGTVMCSLGHLWSTHSASCGHSSPSTEEAGLDGGFEAPELLESSLIDESSELSMSSESECSLGLSLCHSPDIGGRELKPWPQLLDSSSAMAVPACSCIFD
ncbi:uncharacterized protein GGS25DRAFT_478728, partial [Hypoxylon fragiforme]|uniref:uncharacterized protein n=1 Tax=Hypoxylon fragiforme TaxID=63214 RepID=UPI0020C629D7